jgi:hypothetical protein
MPGIDVNHGQKIYIRLRPAHRPDTFLDEEDLIGTMLHEVGETTQPGLFNLMSDALLS